MPVKQVVLSPVCGLWGMGSNEAANTERPQPVISNNLFTTITHNQHQPSRLPQQCSNCLYFKQVGLSAAALHLSATFAVLQSGGFTSWGGFSLCPLPEVSAALLSALRGRTLSPALHPQLSMSAGCILGILYSFQKQLHKLECRCCCRLWILELGTLILAWCRHPYAQLCCHNCRISEIRTLLHKYEELKVSKCTLVHLTQHRGADASIWAGYREKELTKFDSQLKVLMGIKSCSAQNSSAYSQSKFNQSSSFHVCSGCFNPLASKCNLWSSDRNVPEWWSFCGCVADLVSATNTTNVNIPQMADTLFERATNASWVVVFKALVTTHHMCVHGNEVSDGGWGGGVRRSAVLLKGAQIQISSEIKDCLLAFCDISFFLVLGAKAVMYYLKQ